jgi:prepilin-type N-terminal cleavage/methylation domain-containing protein
MNELIPNKTSRTAFTLIELLVVIAVIGILAGMILVVSGRVQVSRAKSLANAELTQVATAIVAYKEKFGIYPPDNAMNVLTNPLYFELVGTILANEPGRGWGYRTLDGSFWIPTNVVSFFFGVDGFVNSSTSLRGDDERPAPVNFLKELTPNQVGIVTNENQRISARVLVCSIGWEGTIPDQAPWRYNSSRPTNNAGTFDLWVDLLLKDSTNRLSNWSKTQQIIRAP